jgi:hypothetical protein
MTISNTDHFIIVAQLIGFTARILKNGKFYPFTYFLRRSKEEIQHYQTTPKVSEMIKYSIFWNVFDYLPMAYGTHDVLLVLCLQCFINVYKAFW